MLDRFHKFAEIIASFAIVGSLIFVGIQVSQNTDATRVSNSQIALQSWSDQSLAMATNAELSQLYYDGAYPHVKEAFPDNGSRSRIGPYMSATLKTVETIYLQWRQGNLPDDTWHSYPKSMAVIFAGHEATNDYWKAARHTFAPSFREFMDERMAEGAKMRATIIANSK